VRVPYEALRQRVTIRDLTGHGSYGPVFARRRTVRASVQQTQALVTDWKNDQIVITDLVIVRPEDGPVPAESLVIDGERNFRVVKCFPIPDDFHPSHYELMVKSWGAEDLPEEESSSAEESSSSS